MVEYCDVGLALLLLPLAWRRLLGCCLRLSVRHSVKLCLRKRTGALWLPQVLAFLAQEEDGADA